MSMSFFLIHEVVLRFPFKGFLLFFKVFLIFLLRKLRTEVDTDRWIRR
jgi:hypothetical protein